RQGIFFIPVILILPSIMGISGVIYAQLIADLLTTLLTVILAVNLKKEMNSWAPKTAYPAELFHEN
ncbi:MAG TPA: hypothetical protein DDW65_07360, partial [Firmicutes bacterium]|nr:hypothetical protein [Bacillota bacterium]